MNKTISLKKYLLLVFLIVCTVLNAQKKFTIVLDAGHGGTDHGANRSYSDIGYISEKEIRMTRSRIIRVCTQIICFRSTCIISY